MHVMCDGGYSSAYPVSVRRMERGVARAKMEYWAFKREYFIRHDQQNRTMANDREYDETYLGTKGMKF